MEHLRVGRLILIVLAVTCWHTNSAVITAPSPSYLDVSNAVYSSTTNDTVLVPAGTALWTNILVISNGITLRGAGTNLTFITNEIPWQTFLGRTFNGSEKPPLIWLLISNDSPMRVTGFYFACNFNYTNNSARGQGIYCDPINLLGYPIVHSLRVDHCIFDRADSRAVELLGAVYGVIDHCIFRNCSLICEPTAGHDVEWNRFTPPYYGLGTTNTIVVENCTYLVDDDVRTNFTSLGAPMACGQGGHYVWRYNLVTNYTTLNIDGLDLHGNNFYYGNDPPYTNTPQPGWRGSIWIECYSNTFNVSTHSFRGMTLRGGTCMVFNNQFNGIHDSCRMLLWEEEGWLVSNFNPLRTNYPAQDQITNSFFWNNTWNGISTNMVYPDNPVTNSFFIQLNRDFYTNSPYQIPYTNGSGVSNAMVSYQPLVYPHPLVTSQDGIVHAQIKGKAIFKGKATIR